MPNSVQILACLTRMPFSISLHHQVLVLVWLASTVAAANSISVFDGVGDGSQVFGGEELVKEFAALDTKPTNDLPEVFTICSSVSLLGRKGSTPDQSFWQLMTRNGSGGMYASITGSLESQKMHTVRISVDGTLIPFTNHSLLKLPMQVYTFST